MGLPLRRKSKKPQPIGKIARIFFWIRVALRALRFIRRARPVIKVALLGVVVAIGAKVASKLRARKSGPVATYSPPPTPTVTSPPKDAPGAGTREAGLDTGTGTETERALAAEKSAGNGGGASAEDDPKDKTPPHGDPVAEQEPPKKS